MTSLIKNLKHSNKVMTFTIFNTNVCYVNALRRIILSEIPILVFKTTPYEENKCNILVNTSRLNNEVIKQRLSCIPICYSDIENFPIKNYLLELDVENKTDTILTVTTEDFKIKDLTTDSYLDDSEVHKIFPPFIPQTGGEYYIDFVRLRPRISDEIPGERIKLNCKFSISNARDDSTFNVAGTCSYGCTPDLAYQLTELAKRKKHWKDEGMKPEEIAFASANWKLLEGMRYVVVDSFDFVLETVGIYENEEIMIKSCKVLINKLETFKQDLINDQVDIHVSENTLPNCYDVILQNEDYTIGNIFDYEMYNTYFNNKILDYVGFKKKHPHDASSVLMVSFVDPTKTISDVKTMLEQVIERSLSKVNDIKGSFDGTRRK